MTAKDYALTLDESPLNDPAYEPRVKPVDGAIPDEVALWGAASQVRWFARFAADIKPVPHATWDRFYVDSTAHRGLCCVSCIEDANEGYGLDDPDACCCIALRAPLRLASHPTMDPMRG